MTVKPLGDAAYLIADFDEPADALAQRIRGADLVGLLEVVSSYDTVGLYVDPLVFNLPDFGALPEAVHPAASKLHHVPVDYAQGEDLIDVARLLNLTPREVIASLTNATFRCEALGFCPGFPYLSGLPDELCGVPRRSSPRPRIAAGTLAITGSQAGIYPMERPGGWALLGRVPLCLVSPDDDYFPIRAGDELRFVEIDRSEFDRRLGERL